MSEPITRAQEHKDSSVERETRRSDWTNPAEMAERVRAELAKNPGLGAALVSAGAEAMDAAGIGRRKGEASGAATIAQQAKAELKGITGLDVDHVSGVEKMPDGWHVTVDLVELRRIPAATDVLAAYEAVLGPTGELLSYHRTRRYFRDQMMEES